MDSRAASPRQSVICSRRGRLVVCVRKFVSRLDRKKFASPIMYYSKTKTRGCFQLEPAIDLKKQSVEISNDGARISVWVGDEGKLRQWWFEDAKTVYEGFRRGARVSNNGDCLGWREATPELKTKDDPMPYRWIKYNDVIRRSEDLARGFLSKGLVPGQESFVGIYSKNRPEWIVTEQACYVYNMILVPIYDTLGADACLFMINQTEMKLVVVESSKKAEALLSKREQCPTLTTVVLIEAAEDTLREKANAAGVEVIQLSELEKRGEQSADGSPAPTPPSPDDVCTISYTSGTTGNPKGATITHGNMMAATTAIQPLKYAVPSPDTTLFSFLPLAHMFERLLQAALYSIGGRAGFYSGDMKLISDDTRALEPTIMAVVPRVLNRIYDKVMQKANRNLLTRFVFRLAVASKTKQLQRGVVRNDSIWDRYVFSEVRKNMGGRLQLMITGSAPIGHDVLMLTRCALGCVVLEGYGQTECTAASNLGFEGDHNTGHVGPPTPCSRVKLVDVPEMGYYTKDGVGEVCFKGHNVFRGYYKDREKTAEVLDGDGWLHSGDIGRWTTEGTLMLVDRKKNIFKLSQGEYVAPEKLESIFTRSRLVAQVFVYGQSLKSRLIAVVAPDPEVLPGVAEAELGVRGTMEELCKNAKVKKAVLDSMVAEGKKSCLASFEMPHAVHLHPELLTVESGLLTPTMKMKRSAMVEKFRDALDEMYRAFT